MSREPPCFPEEIALIHQRRSEGRSLRAIARELDRDHTTVGKYVRKAATKQSEEEHK